MSSTPNKDPFLDLRLIEHVIERVDDVDSLPYVPQIFIDESLELIDFDYADYLAEQSTKNTLVYPFGYADNERHIRRRVAFFSGASIVFRVAQVQLADHDLTLEDIKPYFLDLPFDQSIPHHEFSHDLTALHTIQDRAVKFGAPALRFLSALGLMYGVGSTPQDELSAVRTAVNVGFTFTLPHMEKAVRKYMPISN